MDSVTKGRHPSTLDNVVVALLRNRLGHRQLQDQLLRLQHEEVSALRMLRTVEHRLCSRFVHTTRAPQPSSAVLARLASTLPPRASLVHAAATTAAAEDLAPVDAKAARVRMFDTHWPGFCYRRDGTRRAPCCPGGATRAARRRAMAATSEARIQREPTARERRPAETAPSVPPTAMQTSEDFTPEELRSLVMTNGEADIRKVLCLHALGAIAVPCPCGTKCGTEGGGGRRGGSLRGRPTTQWETAFIPGSVPRGDLPCYVLEVEDNRSGTARSTAMWMAAAADEPWTAARALLETSSHSSGSTYTRDMPAPRAVSTPMNTSSPIAMAASFGKTEDKPKTKTTHATEKGMKEGGSKTAAKANAAETAQSETAAYPPPDAAAAAIKEEESKYPLVRLYINEEIDALIGSVLQALEVTNPSKVQMARAIAASPARLTSLLADPSLLPFLDSLLSRDLLNARRCFSVKNARLLPAVLMRPYNNEVPSLTDPLAYELRVPACTASADAIRHLVSQMRRSLSRAPDDESDLSMSVPTRTHTSERAQQTPLPARVMTPPRPRSRPGLITPPSPPAVTLATAAAAAARQLAPGLRAPPAPRINVPAPAFAGSLLGPAPHLDPLTAVGVSSTTLNRRTIDPATMSSESTPYGLSTAGLSTGGLSMLGLASPGQVTPPKRMSTAFLLGAASSGLGVAAVTSSLGATMTPTPSLASGKLSSAMLSPGRLTTNTSSYSESQGPSTSILLNKAQHTSDSAGDPVTTEVSLEAATRTRLSASGSMAEEEPLELYDKLSVARRLQNISSGNISTGNIPSTKLLTDKLPTEKTSSSKLSLARVWPGRGLLDESQMSLKSSATRKSMDGVSVNSSLLSKGPSALDMPVGKMSEMAARTSGATQSPGGEISNQSQMNMGLSSSPSKSEEPTESEEDPRTWHKLMEWRLGKDQGSITSQMPQTGSLGESNVKKTRSSSTSGFMKRHGSRPSVHTARVGSSAIQVSRLHSMSRVGHTPSNLHETTTGDDSSFESTDSESSLDGEGSELTCGQRLAQIRVARRRREERRLMDTVRRQLRVLADTGHHRPRASSTVSHQRAVKRQQRASRQLRQRRDRASARPSEHREQDKSPKKTIYEPKEQKLQRHQVVGIKASSRSRGKSTATSGNGVRSRLPLGGNVDDDVVMKELLGRLSDSQRIMVGLRTAAVKAHKVNMEGVDPKVKSPLAELVAPVLSRASILTLTAPGEDGVRRTLLQAHAAAAAVHATGGHAAAVASKLQSRAIDAFRRPTNTGRQSRGPVFAAPSVPGNLHGSSVGQMSVTKGQTTRERRPTGIKASVLIAGGSTTPVPQKTSKSVTSKRIRRIRIRGQDTVPVAPATVVGGVASSGAGGGSDENATEAAGERLARPLSATTLTRLRIDVATRETQRKVQCFLEEMKVLATKELPA